MNTCRSEVLTALRHHPPSLPYLGHLNKEPTRAVRLGRRCDPLYVIDINLADTLLAGWLYRQEGGKGGQSLRGRRGRKNNASGSKHEKTAGATNSRNLHSCATTRELTHACISVRLHALVRYYGLL